MLVSFTNPTDAAHHIVYTSGPLGDANSFVDVEATHNSEVENDDAYPFDYETPVLVKSDPEDGSFNLPTGFSSFKLTFDKKVDCAALQATVDSQTMTVTPNTGFASEVTLGCSALADGQHTVKVTKIYPEMRLADEVFGEASITVSVGKVELDPDDVYEVVMTEDFANGGAGWWVTADAGGWQPANSGSGSRIMSGQSGFAPNILYLCTRGIPNNMNGTALYGNHDEKLTLKAKTYHLSLKAARWDSSEATLKVQVFPASAVDEEGNADDSQIIVEESQAIVPDFKTSKDATKFDIAFNVPAEGDYVLKLITGNSAGQPGGYGDGVALGDVKVEYFPNTAGAEETRLLNEALENAKIVRDDNANERYAGEAYDVLVAAITKYEAEKDGYTAPSAYKEAAAALDAAAQAMKDHRALCDDYDTQIKKAIDVERQNKENKFAKTDLYAKLQTIVAKYNGASEWVNESEDPEVENWQLHYTYDVLKDDAALTAAVAELKEIANKAELLFTEGKSTPDNSNNGKGTGVAVLTERIRLGAEALKVLGVSADDEMIQIANDVLSDDDSVAEAIKKRITMIIYGKLKDADNDLFTPVLDENTMEDVTPEYDMTVFVKNPNIYKQLPNMTFTDENVPGWIVPEGFNRPGLTTGWNGPKNVEGVAEDCMFQTWPGSYRVEQTIEDLPVGVYTVKMAFGERGADGVDDAVCLEDSYAYAMTTDMEEPLQTDAEKIGQAFPFAGGTGSLSVENLVVTDGILTIGVNAGPSSHTFFNEVRLVITNAIEGVDYGSLYQEVVDGVEDVKAEQVRAIQLYDLNGRRITTARQGVVIVKKIMSDGSVRTEKVVKK